MTDQQLLRLITGAGILIAILLMAMVGQSVAYGMSQQPLLENAHAD